MNHYEQSGLVFYSEKNFLMATNLFIQGLEVEPENSMLWYGIGDSLCYMSKDANQEELYPIGLSCIKTSFLIDGSNKYASSMLDRMKIHPNIGEEYIEKLQIANMDLIRKFKFDISTEKFISYFDQLKSLDGQIKLVMHIGDSGNEIFLEFIKHCIKNEYNPNIRFAALKRISNYNEGNLESFFEELTYKNKQEELEPYFSIALSSINEDWTGKYINPEFANTKRDNTTFTKEEIKSSLKNDEIRAVIALSLIKIEKQEIQKLFEERNHRILAFYLSNGMNGDGVNFLLKNNILDNRGNILEIGWKHIEQFLNIDFNDSKEPEKTGSISEKPLTNSQAKANKKRWWEVWK